MTDTQRTDVLAKYAPDMFELLEELINADVLDPEDEFTKQIVSVVDAVRYESAQR